MITTRKFTIVSFDGEIAKPWLANRFVHTGALLDHSLENIYVDIKWQHNNKNVSDMHQRHFLCVLK